MIQKLLILVAGLSVGINAFAAYDFKVDGIYYNITSSTEVTVTGNGLYSYSGNVVIPEQVTHDSNTYSVTSIGDNAFTYCSGLTSVTIGDSVTTIGERAFYNCSDLTSVSIGNSVTSIGDYAFYGCRSLTSVTIPDSVTSIGDYAFCGCYSLTSVMIPDSVISIGDSAFCHSESLTSVTIGESVTFIGDNAFRECTALASVTIGESVTSIGDYAFYYCRAMTRLESRAEVPPACGYYALDDINKQTCELFVPIKSLDAYKAADQWKDFVFITGVDYDNPGSVEDAVSENDGVHVVANNDSIEVTGADNAVKTVYNINGQVIYSGTDTTISVPENGIYIVRVAGQTFKVAL